MCSVFCALVQVPEFVADEACLDQVPLHLYSSIQRLCNSSHSHRVKTTYAYMHAKYAKWHQFAESIDFQGLTVPE